MAPASLHFVELERPYSFTSPVPGQAFAAWIIGMDADFSERERKSLADQLIAAGCTFTLCSGIGCDEMDLAIDVAYLDTTPNISPVDDDHYCETSVCADPADGDAAFHFARASLHDHLVVIALGHGPQGSAAFDAARRELAEDT